MRLSKKHQNNMNIYLDKMSQIKPFLPKDWVKKIIEKNYATDKMSITEYNKLYSSLVNLVNGRSYRVYLKRKDLVEAVIKLSNRNKKKHESKTI